MKDKQMLVKSTSATCHINNQYNLDHNNGVRSSVENLLKIVFRVSAERVQQVPIYWRIIHFDTKNSFRASSERVHSAPIYWRIIPFIKEAPIDQDCKWSAGK